jgi:hypothetical protein
MAATQKQTTEFAHADLPVESLVCTIEHAFQRAFAHEAIRTLGAPPSGIAYEAGHTGLRVYASNEMVLARALEQVRAAFNERAAIEGPRVRYRLGKRVEEPVMDLTVQAPGACVETIRADLQQRGAEMVDVSVAPALAIVRARASLQELMGYPEWVAGATDGAAKLSMWLSHYRPVRTAPGPDAA